jgi:rhombotail lipoprotein
MKKIGWSKIAAAAAIALLAVGCAELSHQRSRHRANSLYNFLYPSGTEHVDTPTIPTLSLPLRVGVAFVPTEDDRGMRMDEVDFTETHKAKLLKDVSEHFKSYPFVKTIEIIPTAYLTPHGGFENLDQLKSMYNLDVMALLSYDQAQFTDQGVLSLTYWTIVGAYVIPADSNDTRTMIDAAVYDIPSRKLLFRAPGISTVQSHSTLMYQSADLREKSQQGFEQAASNMVVELKVQMAEFQDRVKNSPTEFKVVHKPGYTGQGNISGMELALIGCAGLAFAMAQRSRR